MKQRKLPSHAREDGGWAQRLSVNGHWLSAPGRIALEGEWRPEPESNRRARICSPLRNHSAIGPRRSALPDAFADGQVGTGWREEKLPVRLNLINRCITGIQQ